MSEVKVRYAIKVNPFDDPEARYIINDSGAPAHGLIRGQVVALWPSRKEAHSKAAYFQDACNATLVKVKKKAVPSPPPLAVGDEVVVRGKVCGLNDVLASVECRSGRFIAPRAEDCERPGWWNGCKP